MKRMLSVVILLAAAFGVTSSTAWAVEPAGKLTKKQVVSLIQSAKTPAEHFKLANYYRYEVVRLEAQAKEHEEMGAAYSRNPLMFAIPKGQLGDHCNNQVKNYRQGAKEAAEMAVMHEEMAKAAK